MDFTKEIWMSRYLFQDNKKFHDGAEAVSIGGSTTDPFEISHGLKQGFVLASTLFTLFLAVLLSTVPEHLIRCRSFHPH